jgi:chromosome segregation ATPase
MDARTIAPGHAPVDDGAVSALEQLDAPKKRRSPWLWVSLALALACIGLLVWGLNTKSDLDSANKHVDQLQNQVAGSAVTGTAVAASYKTAYDDLQKEVGSANADLADTQDQLNQAEDASNKANEDAAAAKDKADKAENETDKANAEADQAKAEAEAAQQQAKVTTECAQALLTSIGAVLQSDDPKSEAETQKKQLEGFAGDCKKALGGT